jgi:restriction system protein
MAVPEFQTIMLPLLEFFSDAKQHTTKETYEFIIKHFELSEDDLKTLIPSGNQELYKNRTGWAKTYLTKAGLLESKARGISIISESGKSVLKEKPARIDLRYLSKFSGMQEFKRIASNQDEQNPSEEISSQTPEEIFEQNYSIINSSLASELLDTIKTCSPAFFERLVVDLLTSMGYGRSIGESKVVGRSGDGGIDGIINEDKLGLESVYIQAKRWQGTVGDIEIRNFIGSLQLKGAKKGVFITTSDFTRQARDSAAMITSIKIVLIDGLTLADLMIEYNVGVSVKTSYEIKRIDSDYFEE